MDDRGMQGMLQEDENHQSKLLDKRSKMHQVLCSSCHFDKRGTNVDIRNFDLEISNCENCGHLGWTLKEKK